MSPRTTDRNPLVGVQASPVAVDRATAAAMLGMGVDSLERYVQPHVRLVRRGRLRLIPVTELQRWVAENAEQAR